MLVIIPTPIGNLKDISIRQYETIHKCDVLACEDTRTTGKLINLLQRLRLKDETMTKLEAFSKPPTKSENINPKDTQNKKNTDKKMEQKSIEKIEPKIELKKIENIGGEIVKSKLTLEQEVKIKNAILEYYANKSMEVPTLNVSKEDVKELIESKYFRKVLDSEDYDNRKKVLEYTIPIIEKRMLEVAKNYDNERKLSYIMKKKPEYEKQNSKSAENNTNNPDSEENSPNSDEFHFIHGIDNDKVTEIKEHIQRIKKKKGRGLLVSVNAENEEKRIPRLLKMMKLGFRVGLMSEAGTPTISDPGSELVILSAEAGISIESLPGPCAATTALSASGLQQNGFVFHGFLPKGSAQKKKILTSYYRLGLPVIIYETFDRIGFTLESIREIYGKDHKIHLGIELTKMHERHMRGTVDKIFEELAKEGMVAKGEITLVIGGLASEKGLNTELDNDEVIINAEELGRILNKSVSMKDKDFKELLIKITGLKQLQVNDIIRRIRPKKRKMQALDKLIREGRNEDG